MKSFSLNYDQINLVSRSVCVTVILLILFLEILIHPKGEKDLILHQHLFRFFGHLEAYISICSISQIIANKAGGKIFGNLRIIFATLEFAYIFYNNCCYS